ncbi:MAG: hypothetical protein U5K70_03925 [Halodesulfurarchaeum sp.]|nr:hypothetical protein [Halodesulfurarchaeum sp.]
MSFDRYLEGLDDDAGGKEHAALALYYLDEVEGQPKVAQAEVRTEIKQSRSIYSPSGVSRYFDRLDGDGLIASVGNGEYRLTPAGVEYVEGWLDETVLVNTRDEGDLFINTDGFESDERYAQLVDDINECYRYRIYDATLVLSRKLFEDLIFQILKTYYSGDDVQMFYDQENSRHYSFDELLNNLSDTVPTLRRFSRELDRSLVEGIRELKDEGNAGAHALRVEFADEEVEAFSGEATRFAEILYDILQGIRIAEQAE